MAPPIFSKRTNRLWTPAGNKSGNPPNTAGSKKVTSFHRFGVNAASNPAASSFFGDPFTVVHAATGRFTLTLGGATAGAGGYGVKKILDVNPKLHRSAASNLICVPGAINEANGTVDIWVINGSTGAATDPAAAGANELITVSITYDAGAP